MQKQTKPKPLGLSMAKVILVVAALVSVAVIIGVVGYLVVNKPKTTLPVMPLNQEKVIISTDKTEYEIGEMVKITLENDLDKEINHNYGGCGGYSFNVQKFIDGKWEYLNTFWGACEIIKNYKVEPGKSEVYNWDQKAYDDSLAKNSLKQVSSGTYRISITYIVDKKVETVYSNEFTIKGKDETADWKTYRNEEYGFEIKYLNDWLVKEEKYDEYGVLSSFYFERKAAGRQEIGYPLIISIENTSIKSVSDWFENEFSDRTEDSKPEKYSVKIGGLDGIKFSDHISIGGCGEDFVVIKNEKLFRILRHSSTCDYSDVVFTQILSTFKFIEKNETADWQNYRNEKFGYEIKYPNGWHVYDDDPAKVYFQKGKEEDIGFETQPFGPHSLAIQISVSESILKSLPCFSL